jgi:hypothetical protein
MQKKYNSKKFILNERTSISFCATEVATALGIRPERSAMELKSFKFATYINDRKQRDAAKIVKKRKKKKRRQD